MVMWPVCKTQYESTIVNLHDPLIILKWMIFVVNLFLLASSFAYLLGILMAILFITIILTLIYPLFTTHDRTNKLVARNMITKHFLAKAVSETHLVSR